MTDEQMQRIHAAMDALRLAALALAKELKRAQGIVRRPRVKELSTMQVVAMLAAGMTHREIARELGISPGTVSRIRKAMQTEGKP